MSHASEMSAMLSVSIHHRQDAYATLQDVYATLQDVYATLQDVYATLQDAYATLPRASPPPGFVISRSKQILVRWFRSEHPGCSLGHRGNGQEGIYTDC